MPTKIWFTATVAAMLLAACGGSATPATPTPAGGTGGLPTTAATQPGGGQTPAPTQAGGGGGGGGTSGGVVVPDGSWTSGTAHLVVSGGATGTFDLTLTPVASISSGGTTLLNYASTNPPEQVTVAIDATSTSIAITSGAIIGGAGTTSDSPCQATFTKADATALQASVACQNAALMTTGGAIETANFTLDFTAAR